MIRIILGCLLFCSVISVAQAETLGVLFPVIEEDLLTVIQRQLANSNLMQKMQSTVSSKISAYMQSLPNHSHLVRIDGMHEHTIVPVVHVPSVNNLPARDVHLLSVVHDFNPVLMFNASDPLQVSWLTQELVRQSNVTVIATGGNVVNAMQLTGHLIAYDNTGDWVKRFEIQGLPAKVTHQGGLVLTVTEGINNDSV